MHAHPATLYQTNHPSIAYTVTCLPKEYSLDVWAGNYRELISAVIACRQAPDVVAENLQVHMITLRAANEDKGGAHVPGI